MKDRYYINSISIRNSTTLRLSNCTRERKPYDTKEKQIPRETEKHHLEYKALTIGPCSPVVLGTMCIFELRGPIPHNYLANEKKKHTHTHTHKAFKNRD